jgi:hypothetical protein
MKRREFIARRGGVDAWARGQQVRRIGVLMTLSAGDAEVESPPTGGRHLRSSSTVDSA